MTSSVPPRGSQRLGDAVDVWFFALESDAGTATGEAEEHELDLSVLDNAERQRAARFHFPRDARRFRFRRAVLRNLLAAYTGAAPHMLELRTNEYGKPETPGLEFSASSSGDLVAIAVGRPVVGIDIEIVRPTEYDTDVAERLFAPEEVAGIGSPADFFRCWTRKEAYVKAAGSGLSFPLQSFAIEVGDVGTPTLFRSALRPQDRYASTVRDLSRISQGWAAAVVAHAPAIDIAVRSTLRQAVHPTLDPEGMR
jgi:4'-phosphopantetheinyl transferase